MTEYLENVPDLADLVCELTDIGARYLVVGGHAVGYHAQPRATKDLDLWIGRDESNRQKVANALRAFGAPEAVCMNLLSAGPEEIVWFGRPPNRVDILQTLPAVNFDESYSRAEYARTRGRKIAIIGATDLLANKRAVARKQDLADVSAIEKMIARRKT